MITKENVSAVMMPTATTPTQNKRMQEINDAAIAFAFVILQNTKVGSDQQAALRKVREAAMTANSAIEHEDIEY